MAQPPSGCSITWRIQRQASARRVAYYARSAFLLFDDPEVVSWDRPLYQLPDEHALRDYLQG